MVRDDGDRSDAQRFEFERLGASENQAKYLLDNGAEVVSDGDNTYVEIGDERYDNPKDAFVHESGILDEGNLAVYIQDRLESAESNALTIVEQSDYNSDRTELIDVPELSRRAQDIYDSMMEEVE